MITNSFTEQLDYICKEKYGHTCWIILSTLSDQEKVEQAETPANP